MTLAATMRRVLMGTALGFAALSAAAAEEWKFAVEEGPGDVQTLYAEEFKRLVEARSGGKIQVTVYTYGQLGNENDLTELTAAGAIQFANASPGHLGTFVPEVQVLSLPFLLPESDKAKGQCSPIARPCTARWRRTSRARGCRCSRSTRKAK